MFTLKKEITWDMAHRVPDHNGKCRNLHGHTYRLIVSISGDELQYSGCENGMLVDFSVIKEALEKVKDFYDHGTCLWLKDPLVAKWMSEEGMKQLVDANFPLQILDNTSVLLAEPIGKLVLMDGPPTAELLAIDVGKLLTAHFGSSLEFSLYVAKLELYETPTSSVVYVVDRDLQNWS